MCIVELHFDDLTTKSQASIGEAGMNSQVWYMHRVTMLPTTRMVSIHTKPRSRTHQSLQQPSPAHASKRLNEEKEGGAQ